MNRTHLSIEDLAYEMYNCMFNNDIMGLQECLSLVNGPQAVLWENSGALRLAIYSERNHFLPLLLPYASEEDAGFALSMSLAEGELAAFDLLMQYNGNFARHLDESTLRWVGGHYARALNDTSDEKEALIEIYTQILQKFFKRIPGEVVEWQLGAVAACARESEHNTKIFEMIERLWSEHVKSVLRHQLDCVTAPAATSRKI